ncbi:hypothetical protein ACFL1E_03950 [Candidatus Omnitrophota bacterium]
MKKIVSRILIIALIIVLAVPGFYFAKKGIAFLQAKTHDVRYLNQHIELTKVTLNEPSIYNPQASLSIIVDNTGSRDIYKLILRIEYFDNEDYKIKDTKIDVLQGSFTTIKKQTRKSIRILFGPEEYPYDTEVANHKIIKSSCWTLESVD